MPYLTGITSRSGAVVRGQRLAPHLVAEQSLGMEGAGHVEPHVVFAVGCLERGVAEQVVGVADRIGGPAAAGRRSRDRGEVGQPRTGPVHDRAPALDAAQLGRHLDPGEGLDVVESERPPGVIAGRPDDLEPPGGQVEASSRARSSR